MDELYEDVSHYKINVQDEDFKIRVEVLEKIARQTTECCLFIQHYGSKPGFCE